MYVAALDIGYGNLKRAAGESSGPPDIETWTACAMPASAAGIDLFGAKRTPDVMLDGDAWYIGMDPADMTWGYETLHSDYVGSPPWRAQFRYGLTHGVTLPKLASGACGIDRLILGLPVDEWLEQSTRDKLRQAAQAELEAISVDVSDLRIMPQPLGAYVDANFAAGGKLVQGTTLVIDAGYNTLDWTLFRRGKLADASAGTSRVGGIARLIEGIVQALRARDGSRVNEGVVRTAIQTGGTVPTRAGEVDCGPLLDEQRARLTGLALSGLQRSLRTTTIDINAIVLTGGGATHYRTAVHDGFPGISVHQSSVPVQSNVRGFWFYGAHRDDK